MKDTFKVGDEVMVINKGDNDCSSHKIGDIFIIEEIVDGFDCNWLRSKKGNATGISDDYCKLITKKEFDTKYITTKELPGIPVGTVLGFDSSGYYTASEYVTFILPRNMVEKHQDFFKKVYIPIPQETIEINGKTYNKSEVEERLKELKSI